MRWTWFVFLIILPSSFASIAINEIFPDPLEDDHALLPEGEWIELKITEESVNYSIIDFYILDVQNKTLILTENNSRYFVDSNNTFVVVYRNGDSSFFLNNDCDSVFLYNINHTLLDNVSYCNAKKGLSYGLFNNTFLFIDPTPGKENTLPKLYPIVIESNREWNFSLGVKYDDFFKIKNSHDETLQNVSFTFLIYGVDNITILVNDTTTFDEIKSYKTSGTGNYTFIVAGNYTLCGISSIILNNVTYSSTYCNTAVVTNTSTDPCDMSFEINSEQLFEDKIEYLFTIHNETHPFFIQYWITDIFNETVKDAVRTQSTGKKTYAPTSKDQIFILHATLFPSCNDTSKKDNYAQKVVMVKGTPRPKEPFVKIESISLGSDKKAKFGEAVSIKLNLYRGNSTRYAVDTYITDGTKKISKTSTTHILEQFTESTISVPVLITSNCKENRDDGTYLVVVEGFEVNDTEEIRLEGILSANCETIRASSPSSTKTKEKNIVFTPGIEDTKLSFPKAIIAGTPFVISFNLSNTAKDEILYNISSYAYKGSKVYSPSREHNVKQIVFGPGETKEIQLEDVVLESGIFSYKVKLFRSNYKTAKEITYTIFVEPSISSKQGFENVSVVSMQNGSFNLKVSVLNGDIVFIDHPFKEIEKSVRSKKKFMISLSSVGESTPLYLRLYKNETLTDVAFILVEDNSSKKDEKVQQIKEKIKNYLNDDPKEIVDAIDTVSTKALPLTGNVIYESDRFKHLDYALYFLIGVLTILCTYFILFSKK